RSVVYFHPPADRTTLPSFPTRRSSDLVHLEALAPAAVDVIEHPLQGPQPAEQAVHGILVEAAVARRGDDVLHRGHAAFGAAFLGDRKSTRLNSSHSQISYAVFCLKKKN